MSFSSFATLGGDNLQNPSEFGGRVFDRRVLFDERSRSYNVADVLEVPKPRSYTWPCAPHLDQRSEGACVGFGLTHEIAAKPKVHPVTEDMARNIYYAARKIDPWPGEAYEGTAVLAGVKVVQSMGFLDEYRWAFNLNDFLIAVSHKGPGVIGVNWYEGMMRPDPDGTIHATGEIVGGHCTLVKGVNVPKRLVKIHQSWGRSHGIDGDVLLSWDDLGKLLDEDGEALIPLKRG